MCRVAWQGNYDNFWQDVENLYVLDYNRVKISTGEERFVNKCYPALAPEIASKIALVESATRFRYPRQTNFLVNENQFALHTYYVDDSFFDVFQIKMIAGGNPKEILKNRSNVIISEKTAKLLFFNDDVLGKEIKNENGIYTVSGICKDLPENSSWLPNIHIIIGSDIPMVFDGMDSYLTYLRTYQKTNLQELNQEINTLLEPRYQEWVDDIGVKISFRATNIHNYYKELDIKATIISFALLLIAGLNFALLSISSLTSRAKEVGVRKASGAKTFGIFSLIIWETVIYVLIAAFLSGILFFVGKSQLEGVIGNYENIFALSNLWAVALVMVVLIFIAGVLPAWIFARIPVTQVFQRFVSNRLYWKRILLFLQFTASIFIISIMFVALRQYQVTITHNYGYDQDKLLWMEVDNPTEAQIQTLFSEIGSDSRVEAINFSSIAVFGGFSGMQVSLEPYSNDPLIVRYLDTDSVFFRTYGITILQGNNHITANYDDGGNVVVNEAFLQLLQIESNPLGVVFYRWHVAFTIVGVCQNFETLSGGITPMMILLQDKDDTGIVVIRVNVVTTDVVETIQKKIKLCYLNTTYPEIQICSDTIFWNFYRLHLDGKIAIIASICLLLITIMGILGYVNMETRRRTKEIAIRKIHGSTAIAIVWKITHELLIIALVAATIAIPLACMYGIKWQQDFVVKANLSWYLFACAAFIVVITVVVCAVLQTWSTANSNPAKSIKLE
jgi:putative ABC transport system permease protein